MTSKSTFGDDRYSPEFYFSMGAKRIAHMEANGTVEEQWNFGILAKSATKKAVLFSDVGKELEGSGEGKTVLLYDAVRQVMGRDLDPGPQRIGDCVSWGWSAATDVVACVQAVINPSEEFSYDLRTCTEAFYALSRVEYGNLDGSYSDGSVGEWANEAALKGGTFSRKRLGPYDPKRAKEWGAKGVPDDIEPEGKLHLFQASALVTSYEQARDCIANGIPVPVCSGVGFEGRRDSEGFIKRRGSWNHCMCFIGCKDVGRKGLLIKQSWGNDHEGEPKGEYDLPDCCWWVDASTCTQMLSERDSFAPTRFMGYVRQNLPWVV